MKKPCPCGNPVAIFCRRCGQCLAESKRQRNLQYARKRRGDKVEPVHSVPESDAGSAAAAPVQAVRYRRPNACPARIGAKIAAHRKAKGVKQFGLSVAMGVSACTVSTWERDVSYPSPHHLANLAKFFGLTVDELMRGE